MTALRSATPDDAAAVAAIYEPYVLETAITFETEPPGAGEMAQRIAATLDAHAWLVLEEAGRVCGYAYGGTFRSRAAYRFSTEVSVYVERGRARTGAGRALYGALLGRLGERGFRTAVAGMTVPNAASEGLHLAMGFQRVGTFTEIGYKFGAWHDVAWFQRRLAVSPSPGGSGTSA